jgi:hypothetical protein
MEGVPRATALLATFVLATGTGCFGYNHGAKAWSYVGDSLLIVGGGAAIGTDLATKPAACEGAGCPSYTAPFSGQLVIGAVLVAAGVAGMIINATRDNLKTSR